jgi:hypothetical protein
MGIGKSDFAIINELREKHVLPKAGRVIELGAQQLSGDTELLSPDAPYAKETWESLGYKYRCIDIDGSSHAIPLDLNYDKVPLFHRRRYDLVTNFGTTEHVANQLNAFQIIHDLTKVGGIMVHNLPAQGYHNHGLVNYNMKFFWMLARSNNYRWQWMDFRVESTSHPIPQDIVEDIKRYPHFASDLSSYSVPNCGIVVALQRRSRQRFIPPLDVNTGTKTSNWKLKRRYPTVFR